MLMVWCLGQLEWIGWVLVTAALVGYWSLVGIGTWALFRGLGTRTPKSRAVRPRPPDPRRLTRPPPRDAPAAAAARTWSHRRTDLAHLHPKATGTIPGVPRGMAGGRRGSSCPVRRPAAAPTSA